jgi:hypothetical protein
VETSVVLAQAAAYLHRVLVTRSIGLSGAARSDHAALLPGPGCPAPCDHQCRSPPPGGQEAGSSLRASLVSRGTSSRGCTAGRAGLLACSALYETYETR